MSAWAVGAWASNAWAVNSWVGMGTGDDDAGSPAGKSQGSSITTIMGGSW